MYAMNSRSRIWIEIPSLDLTDQVSVSDALSSTNQAFSGISADSASVSDAIGEHVWGVTSDSVLVSEALIGSVSAPLISDGATMADAIDSSEVTAGPITDGASVSDSLLGGTVANAIDDALLMADAFTSVASITLALSDSAVASDQLKAGWSAATVDSVTVGEILLTHTVPVEIHDVAATVASIAGTLLASSSTSNSAAVSDLLGYGFVGVSADAATVADSLSGSAFIPVGLSDSVLSSDALSGAVSVYADLLDFVGIDTSIGGSLALVGVLSDAAMAGDTISDQAYQVILVVNATTGAVSTYTVTPMVRGLAEFSGVLYLATDSGLYALDADADADGDIVWTVRTGFSNLGSDFKKRVRDVNVLGHFAGPVSLRTASVAAGAKVEHSYLLPSGARTTHRDGVINVGGGITSVYWAFEVRGRGEAEIDQLRVFAEQLSSRR